jgi:hypothetical protein
VDFVDIINEAALVSKLLLFLVNIVGAELILWFFGTGKNSRVGRFFLAGAIYILLWLDIDFISAHAAAFFSLAQSEPVMLWAFRSMYALLAVFFGVFYCFCLNFPAANPLDPAQRRKNGISTGIWSFFFSASFSSFIVESAVFDPDLPVGSRIIPGPLFWVYCLAAVLTFAFSFYELSRRRLVADSQNRQKARLVALAAGVFGFLNLIFNVLGPALGEWWGCVGFFALFMDYAVVSLLGYVVYLAARDRLAGIKVILVEIFVGLMGASLAVIPFFVELLWQRSLLIVLFVLFCGFGYVLIQGSIKEYREKELLEQKVTQRTHELELAKSDLEENNLTLEVRVRARTRELEFLNQTLEEKIMARTRDLEAKVRDLEKFQKITVGRELKMIELKREIERLSRNGKSLTANENG